MIKIIETHTTLEDFCGEPLPIDTQSRIIEIKDWDEYVEEIRNQKQVVRKSITGNLEGVSFPKDVVMKTFKFSDDNLLCTFYLWNKVFALKTACICK